MKKIIVLMLVLASVLCGTACGKKAEVPTVTEKAVEETTKSVSEKAPAKAPLENKKVDDKATSFDPTDIYDKCIADYRQAIEEQLPATTLAKANMSQDIIFLYAEDKPLSKIGYIRHDFDGDGIDELLIGPIYDEESHNEGIIYHMFTANPTKGTYKDLFVSTDRDQLYLCKDYSFVREFAPAEDISQYQIMDGELKIKEIIQRESVSNFDFMKKEFYTTSSWTHIEGDGGENSVVSPMTDDQALDTVTTICENYMQIPYTPFSELK